MKGFETKVLQSQQGSWGRVGTGTLSVPSPARDLEKGYKTGLLKDLIP